MTRYLTADDEDLEFAIANMPATLWVLLLLDTDLKVTEEETTVLLALAALHDLDAWTPWGAQWYSATQLAQYTRLPQELGVQRALDRLVLAGLVKMNGDFLFRPLTVGDAR